MSQQEFGRMIPAIKAPPPGPASRSQAKRLRRVESRNVTWLSDDFPVFWEEARGANVRDADGNVFLDLTGGFGVALTGHGDPRIRRAASRQMELLVHAMGDVHPPTAKVALLERLERILPWKDTRTVLTTGGAEAVEVALKTALLATGRPGILAFEGGYHGLTMGALAATARSDFRAPFADRLYAGTRFVPFPGGRSSDGGLGGGRPVRGPESVDATGEAVLSAVEGALREGAPGGDPIGAVVVEPVQGRAGVRIPPEGFLSELGALARNAGALIVADEIFTGLGRTGAFLESEAGDLAPDLICLGKALGGGFPLGSCSGPADVMDAWPPSGGEALHTSTFLGHPVACAAGLALLEILEDDDLPARARSLGARLLQALRSELEGVPGVTDVRGRGLMMAIELGEGEAARAAIRALAEGVLVLPAGMRGDVVELAPPVVLTEEQVEASVSILGRAIRGAVEGASVGGRP